MSTKTTDAPEAKTEGTEIPKKEVMGIERDDHNTRLSFTTDGQLMIVTIPIGRMSPALVHGFLWELHDIVKQWFEERKKTQIITRDNMSKFSFKQGISKLFKK